MTEMMTLNHVECLESVIAPGKLWNAIWNSICDFFRGFCDAL